MAKLTRRKFIQSSAAASTAFGLFTIAGTKSSGRVLGANDTVRVGVAGIRGRGQSHIDAFSKELKNQNVQITYLIDPDTRLFESRSSKVTETGAASPTCVKDIRKALEDPNLDVVTVATCNHWHSLITIWACQAGKDVYVEKPISHNVFEGRKCVEAAKKYGRVVQHGTQQRSSQKRAEEIAALQSGKYGKLLVSKGYCCKPRWSIGFKPFEDPPADLDFNIWLGPAPEQPYHGNLVPYNWHWFWDTGNGDIGNQGVHEMDVARWAIKGATLPKSVWSLGGRFGYEDQGQTPNTQMAVFDYGDALLVFEVRGLVGNKMRGDLPNKVLNEYYTTEGVIREGMFYRGDGAQGEPLAAAEAHVTPGGPFGSFLSAVRSRRPEDINADAEVAHYSAALCHLANISFRLGDKVETVTGFSTEAKGDEKPLASDPRVAQTYMNLRDNLAAIGENPDQIQYQLGPKLEFDAKTEKFVGAKADVANPMLTRPYRAPFVVPQQV